MVEWIILGSILLLWGYFRYLGPVFVTYQILDPRAFKPTKSYDRAACFDIYAIEDITIPEGEWREIHTGVAFAAWPHFYLKWLNLTITPFGNVTARIYTRSGHARKGLRAHLGVVDNDFRDEWTILMFNQNYYPIRFRPGDRVAQFEFHRVTPTFLFPVKNLSSSKRGKKGWGSSGR